MTIDFCPLGSDVVIPIIQLKSDEKYRIFESKNQHRYDCLGYHKNLIYFVYDIYVASLWTSQVTMITDIKIGITGLPGSGKTYALLRVVDMLRSEEEISIGGMVDEPIQKDRKKVGFTVRNLLTGQQQVFASTEIESKIMVGKIGVDLAKLEEVGVQAIRDAMEQCDVIVIDEVGKMEVESEAFVNIVKESLEVDKPMIITLHKKSRNPLLQDIRRRDDVRILEVTPTNRNLLPYKIVRLMHGENV